MVFPANHKYRRRTEGTSLTGGRGMGYVYADIELTNEDDVVLHRHGLLLESEIKKVKCKALVDSGYPNFKGTPSTIPLSAEQAATLL